MNDVTFDLDSASLVFKCLKIGKILEKPFTCYLLKNQIFFMKECDYGCQELKYKLPIELSTHVKWEMEKKQENGQKVYRLLSFKFSQNDVKSGSRIKWFKGCESDLLQFKELLRNRVLFQRIQDFYTPLQTLGKGSSARILLVRHKISEQFYAAKCIDKTYVNDSEYGLVQMYQEISIQSEFVHPAFIQLHAVYEGDNTFYMVMDLVKGNSLFEELKKNRDGFPMSTVETIMTQIMSGIEYMHSKRIIHRDLKPDNIMFFQKNDFNSLKIVDFGLATRMDVDQYLFPKCGTPGFVAPEVANLVDKNNKYDRVCDIFSAGAIFYQIVSGQQVFPGNGFNQVLKLNKQCKIDPTPLLLKKVPQDIINLILRMLESDPNKRPQASEVLRDPFFTKKVKEPSPAHKKIFFQSLKKDAPIAQTVDITLNSDEYQHQKPLATQFNHFKDQIPGSFVVKENLYVGLNANQVQQNKQIFKTTEFNKKLISDDRDQIQSLDLQEQRQIPKIDQNEESKQN